MAVGQARAGCGPGVRARDGDTPRVPKVAVELGWEGSCRRGCLLLGGMLPAGGPRRGR